MARKKKEQFSKRDIKSKDIHIGLHNIDSAIKYYFDNVIKLNVGTDDKIIKVPIKYANEERWKNIRRNNARNIDTKQLELPLIVYKRTSITRNENMPMNKLNPLDPQLHRFVTREYNSKNKYDNFFKLTNQKPTLNIHNIIIPDYIILSYDFMAWTNYAKEMNKIIEGINYHAGSYWGTDQFKFITKVDDFSSDTITDSKTDRRTTCTFSMTLKGYLVPDMYNKILSNQIVPSVKKISFKEHIITKK